MSKNTDLGSLVNYIKGQVSGRLNAPAYTSATAFTGTITGFLGFDTSGNILTTNAVIGGSGTTNYIPKFTASTSLGTSVIYDNGSNVGINNTNPLTKLHIIAGDAGTSGRIRLTHGSGTAQIELYTEPSGLATIISTNALSFETGGAERMRISSTGAATFLGTVGIGNAISAWGTGTFPKVLQVGNASLVTNGTAFAQLTNNMYYDGSAYRYITSNGASRIVFESDGVITFNNATSGTAGNTVSTSERMRITADGGLNINTSTTGYTFNAIASTSTQFNAVYKGSGFLVQIMSRFISDTSANKGIAIGYATLGFSTTSGIWATQAGSFQLGVLDGTTYKSKINMNTTTIAIDIPSSPTGLASGQLYNDGNYVRIV